MAAGDVASRVRAIMENMRANAECADKQASACDAIANMAFGRAATVGSVAGVFDAIMGAMRRHEGVAKVQEQACRALRDLAWNNERRAREALKRADEAMKRVGVAEMQAAREKERADRAEAPPQSPVPTPATARLAMVIANAEYQGPVRNLPCCARDGDAMEATLQARGFAVTRRNNARSRGLHDAVDAFGRLVTANPGCIAVWYFTGHGVETEDGGANLVPVDRGLGGALLRLNALERALQESAEVRDAAAGQRPTTIIIILDCCRENENNETYKNTGGGGVARPNVRHYGFQAQYLVAHACESGTVARAQVGDAVLSPFTDALVPPLREGVPLQVALNRATTVVARQTQHTQRPSYRCSLGWDDEAGAPLVL